MKENNIDITKLLSKQNIAASKHSFTILFYLQSI